MSRKFLTIVFSPDDEAECGKGFYGDIISEKSKGEPLWSSPLFETKDQLWTWARKKSPNVELLKEFTD